MSRLAWMRSVGDTQGDTLPPSSPLFFNLMKHSCCIFFFFYRPNICQSSKMLRKTMRSRLVRLSQAQVLSTGTPRHPRRAHRTRARIHHLAHAHGRGRIWPWAQAVPCAASRHSGLVLSLSGWWLRACSSDMQQPSPLGFVSRAESQTECNAFIDPTLSDSSKNKGKYMN